MAPTSWRSLASSHLASFKHYVEQKDYKGTYDALSSRVRGKRVESDIHRGDSGVVKVHIFPGWAVRRYRNPSKLTQGSEFDLDIYVSGFASSTRLPEDASRSQRAFYRLAKSYASLPKLPIPPNSGTHAPARPAIHSHRSDSLPSPSSSKHSPEDMELGGFATLEAQLREISGMSSALPDYHFDDSDGPSGSKSNRPFSSQHDDVYALPCHPEVAEPTFGATTPTSSIPKPASSRAASFPDPMTDYEVQQFHANLDARLQPFLSSAISNTVIRLSIFCPPLEDTSLESATETGDTHLEPLAFMDVTTSPQGAFQAMFKVPWKRLATYPPSLHIAFGETDIEYPVVIQAEINPPPPLMSSPSSHLSPIACSPDHHDYTTPQRSEWPRASSLSPPSFPIPSSPQSIPVDFDVPVIRNHITLSLSMSDVPVRLISDIDDTVKYSGVLKGAKHVFRNVFVRNLEEVVIHSMVHWYKALWDRGVRFHYVSNSPLELLPMLTEFFYISSLPEGSIKLKSYAARSFLPTLLSPPAARKRPGVVEVLDAFPESRFILVGDTGEQDMELYAELARERPGQIVAVLLRDVTTGTIHEPWTPLSETGYLQGASKVQIENLLIDTQPAPIEAMPSLDTLRSTAWATSRLNNAPGCASPSRDLRPDPCYHTLDSPDTPATSQHRYPSIFPRRNSFSGEERRRSELQMRIERARAEIPTRTVFRVFREPNECVEVQHILDQLMRSKKR